MEQEKELVDSVDLVDLVLWCPEHPTSSDRDRCIWYNQCIRFIRIISLFKDLPISMQKTAAPVVLQSNYRIKRITELPN